MSILINPQHMRMDFFRFKLNLKGCPGDGTAVTIQFRNGKFDSAFYDFKGTLSREQWKVLSEINRMIGEIEKQFKGVRK